MTVDGDVVLRPARTGDGAAVFEVTRQSIRALAKGHYSEAQLAGWMGDRTPAYYEDLIAQGRMVVAERDRRILGFVDAEAGEVTRLFLLAEAAGAGLGRRLLEIGIAAARAGHAGPIRLEATINAEGFYRRHGFRTTGRGVFSHGLGGDPIEVVHMEL
ncbi:GNAT family N-acetyltransferase [Plastoroseomonas hellenica]|uniref:GNAT family N-acetyltransferase n=1 Tax=Plastoroseomonas hellenica TaxID=2687306 RepID=UPI001BABE3B8|nr:GNAT family N-acetyltransferase [Plastoroseomonas hellenica]MBR0641584.1 GNAT family N-acetyltransferase [Plastoroseomonas hellenica]